MRLYLTTALVALAAAMPSGAVAQNLVANGNFSAGNVGFGSDYPFTSGPAGSARGTPTYAIGTDAATTANAYPDWGGFGDHTSGTGNMLVADGALGNAWFTDVTLAGGTVYDWTFWAHTVHGNTGGSAILSFLVNGVALGVPLTLPANSASSWQQLSGSFSAVTSGTARIAIADLNGAVPFNDFALDDISFTARATPGAVPEPAGWALMIGGFGIVGGTMRRRRATTLATA